jgi:hypothetical protein
LVTFGEAGVAEVVEVSREADDALAIEMGAWRRHRGHRGKTVRAQVKESGSATFGGPPAEWSLHCGACRTPLMTTVFEKLSNPFFRNLTEKNQEQYEKNRKKVVHWLLAGWPETQERLRTNDLIAGGAWAHKRHLAYLKRQFPELLHLAAESA